MYASVPGAFLSWPCVVWDSVHSLNKDALTQDPCWVNFTVCRVCRQSETTGKSVWHSVWTEQGNSILKTCWERRQHHFYAICHDNKMTWWKDFTDAAQVHVTKSICLQVISKMKSRWTELSRLGDSTSCLGLCSIRDFCPEHSWFSLRKKIYLKTRWNSLEFFSIFTSHFVWSPCVHLSLQSTIISLYSPVFPVFRGNAVWRITCFMLLHVKL